MSIYLVSTSLNTITTFLSFWKTCKLLIYNPYINNNKEDEVVINNKENEINNTGNEINNVENPENDQNVISTSTTDTTLSINSTSFPQSTMSLQEYNDASINMLSYWIIVALLHISSPILSILSWLPLTGIIKLIMMIYLLFPNRLISKLLYNYISVPLLNNIEKIAIYLGFYITKIMIHSLSYLLKFISNLADSTSTLMGENEIKLLLESAQIYSKSIQSIHTEYLISSMKKLPLITNESISKQIESNSNNNNSLKSKKMTRQSIL